ncbi:Zinc finger CCCH domain-containing protein 28 [Smittium mucronatum]|uniref:Zinc finger CCCH domain-containing protein 28 n=1 Tax=Smittium mucronatum TaxID=133383 RepID=A0A1R0GUT1_9FUNG|nr:Zinc finger CCCH domain-containing protein 28 [Smittium mucronatum]
MDTTNTTGLIIFRAAYNKPVEYLLFSDNYSNDRHWSPPKGKLFLSEDEEKGALRNVCEITGIPAKEIEVKNTFRAKIKYISGTVLKNAVFYLGRVLEPFSSSKAISDSAGLSFSWFQLDKALEKVVFTNIKDILVKAEEFILKNRDLLFKPAVLSRDSAFNKPSNESLHNSGQSNHAHNFKQQNSRFSKPTSKFVKPSPAQPTPNGFKDQKYPNNDITNKGDFGNKMSNENERDDYNWRYKSKPNSNSSANVEQIKPLNQVESPEVSSSSQKESQTPVKKNETWRFKDYECDWADEDMDSDWGASNINNASTMMSGLSLSKESQPSSQINSALDRDRNFNQYNNTSVNSSYKSHNYRNDQNSSNQSYDDSLNNINNQNYKSSQGYNQKYQSKAYPSNSNFDNDKRFNDYVPKEKLPLGQSSHYNDQNNRSNGFSHNNQESSLYKTKLCEKYTVSGECPYDSKCVFAHGESDLRTRPVSNSIHNQNRPSAGEFKKNTIPLNNHDLPENNPMYKTSLCDRYKKFGNCYNGDNCNFAHGPEELRRRVDNRNANQFQPGDRNIHNHTNYISNPIGSKAANSFNSNPTTNNFNLAHRAPSSSSTYFGPRNSVTESGMSNKPLAPLSGNYENNSKPLIYSKTSNVIEKSVPKNHPDSDAPKPKVGAYIPPNRKINGLQNKPPNLGATQSTSNEHNKNLSNKDYSKKSIFPPELERKNHSKNMKNDLGPLNDYRSQPFSKKSSSLNSNTNPSKLKAKQAEKSLINTFATYFYGPDPFSQPQSIFIERPINEELKELTRVEFRLNLTKKQLILGLILGIFLPTEGKIQKSFITSRIELLKKIVRSEDQQIILTSLLSLYNYGVDQSNFNTFGIESSSSLENVFSDMPSKPENNKMTADSSNVWASFISNLLVVLYDQDIVEEDVFLVWYSQRNKTTTDPATKSMATFAKWLK